MGKFWKWPTFSVSIGVENPEKMCAWKTLWLLFCSLFLPLLKMVLLFKLTLIELQDFWLHLKPPFFLSYLQKSLDFPTKIVDKKKKKTFVPWEKLMENYYNCIGVSSIENWKMSSWICSTWKIDGKNDFMPDSLFLGVLIDQISFSSFFSNIFRDSFTLEKVFPPRSFLSTLLHCLPTFIPTTQKIQMLWCNPKLHHQRIDYNTSLGIREKSQSTLPADSEIWPKHHTLPSIRK